MKFIYKIILIFVIFFSSSVVAKNIEITGVNFEKKYDNILDKIYFYFFVNKKTATLLDIANIKNDHHIMCLYPSKINLKVIK